MLTSKMPRRHYAMSSGLIVSLRAAHDILVATEADLNLPIPPIMDCDAILVMVEMRPTRESKLPM